MVIAKCDEHHYCPCQHDLIFNPRYWFSVMTPRVVRIALRALSGAGNCKIEALHALRELVRSAFSAE